MLKVDDPGNDENKECEELGTATVDIKQCKFIKEISNSKLSQNSVKHLIISQALLF